MRSPARRCGVNLSDLAAKGAKPAGFLLTLALAEGAPATAWLKRFARGLGAAARHYGCPLLGGDTVRTPGPVTISITAFGTLPKGTMVQALRRARWATASWSPAPSATRRLD